MNNKKLVIGIVVAVALAGGLVTYFVARPARIAPVAVPAPSPQNPPAASQPQPSTNPLAPKTTSTISKPATKSGPSVQAAITGVVLSKTIDASGAPVNPDTTFSPSTPTIYAILTLKNAVQRTELSYVRYYEGKYIDAKVSHPTRNGVRYFHFEFALKPGQTRKAGHYTLNLYVNGKKAQSVSYIVR